MKAIYPTMLAACALWMGPPSVSAAETTDATVRLPPIIVGDGNRGSPWYYVRTETFEILTRCSRSTTRDFVQMRLRLDQVLRVLVPPEFLRRSDVPATYVLYPQDMRNAADAVLQGMVDAAKKRSVPAKPALPSAEISIDSGSRATFAAKLERSAGRDLQFLPNQRIEDRDITVGFAYIDEGSFEASGFTLTPDNVFAQMSLRTPALPWAVALGVSQVFADLTVGGDKLHIGPFTWLSPGETTELRRDPQYPRAMLSVFELFAADKSSGTAAQLQRNRVWQSQAELFFRWALQDPARLKAYWKFAALSAQEPVTEAMIQACFGMNSADVRDELSDYLPKAVVAPITLSLARLPKLPAPEIRTATPVEIARLRGEWERAEITYVKNRHPEYVDRYVEQARRTLRRAYGDGDRDPRLLAALGLCEVDAGDDAAARGFLEAAAAGGVVRPRVYVELARLRENGLAAVRTSPNERYSVADIAPVVESLRIAAGQMPQLPQTYLLLAEVWRHCAEPAPASDLALMVEGARLFPRHYQIATRTAGHLDRQGRLPEAVELLRMAIRHNADENRRGDLVRLLAEIEKPRS